MNYKHLGNVNFKSIEKIKKYVTDLKKQNPFQSILIPDILALEFQSELFPSKFNQIDLKINHSKIFLTKPGGGHVIHKDGLDKKVALNVAITCNDEDWVRWYSEEEIVRNNGKLTILNVKNGHSRNIDIVNYQDINYIEEVHNKEGDVYLVNTDIYHTFKNNGTKDRIILQTKFDPNPSIEELYIRIQETGLNLQ